MAAADRLTIEQGLSGFALMQAAGAAVAKQALSLITSEAGRILVLCGPGNNGGDGLIAARLLQDHGLQVIVAALNPEKPWTGDAAKAQQLWKGPILPLSEPILSHFDLVIDGLFGAGLTRPLEGQTKSLIEAINAFVKQRKIPLLAIDLPSGVNGDTGAIMGAAIEAHATVTFFQRKPGHLLLPGRSLCGQIHVEQIGIAPQVMSEIRIDHFANEPSLWASVFPQPAPTGHKYHRGHVLVLSGNMISTGAARLAARGALRCGAGLVTLASPSDALAVNAAHLSAIMLRSCDGPRDLKELLQDQRKNAFVIGPGLGTGHLTRVLVETALRDRTTSRALVLDADALTCFADTAEELATWIKAYAGPVVLTPHEGEFARLFPDSEGSRLERARNAAKRMGAVILLKGADTIVANPDGRASIAANAPAFLATAGAGDVLCGFIAALLAQAMPAFEAASAAVWLHSECASAFGPGLIAEDLPEILPEILHDLAEAR
ncbi:MAG: NAD(P)H-hydrate dehydratase [Alphaproteobacteria bacterium]|nr:NAD(P)H-hydrate dehydratase [Alphaproteobacteria bacterium]